MVHGVGYFKQLDMPRSNMRGVTVCVSPEEKLLSVTLKYFTVDCQYFDNQVRNMKCMINFISVSSYTYTNLFFCLFFSSIH